MVNDLSQATARPFEPSAKTGSTIAAKDHFAGFNQVGTEFGQSMVLHDSALSADRQLLFNPADMLFVRDRQTHLREASGIAVVGTGNVTFVGNTGGYTRHLIPDFADCAFAKGAKNSGGASSFLVYTGCVGLTLATLAGGAIAYQTNASTGNFSQHENLWVPKVNRHRFFDDLRSYAEDDWDGNGAHAITSTDADNAQRILHALEHRAPFEPDIVAGADGSVCMEWNKNIDAGDSTIFVDAGPDGKVLTFAKFGAAPPIEKHFAAYGPAVDDHLRAMFNSFVAG